MKLDRIKLKYILFGFFGGSIGGLIVLVPLWFFTGRVAWVYGIYAFIVCFILGFIWNTKFGDKTAGSWWRWP